MVFFPHLQRRVVRFYQSVVLLLLLLQFLLDHVCITSTSTSALPTLRQALRQLPGSVPHCWTSTWDLPSSVRTAGPHLGPSQLSAHRWTSTWDLPSSVRTAGPQKPNRMPEDMPDRTPDSMSDRMPEDVPDKMPEDMPDRMP